MPRFRRQLAMCMVMVMAMVLAAIVMTIVGDEDPDEYEGEVRRC